MIHHGSSAVFPLPAVHTSQLPSRPRTHFWWNTIQTFIICIEQHFHSNNKAKREMMSSPAAKSSSHQCKVHQSPTHCENLKDGSLSSWEVCWCKEHCFVPFYGFTCEGKTYKNNFMSSCMLILVLNNENNNVFISVQIVFFFFVFFA